MNDVWLELYWAKNEIKSFFNIFPLKTSLSPGRTLYQALLAIVPDDFSLIKLQDEEGNPQVLSSGQAFSIREAVNEFETVLKAELSGWDAYFVSQKGAFSTSDLIDGAETMLVESARSLLSKEALEDIRQTGRCLAFNLGTAAAFHVVRATETFIWKYYEEVVGNLPPVKMRNWGAYIRNLEKTGKADNKIIGWMKQIKDEYRNPVLHPNETVSPDDALEFINACLSLMASIARVLNKNRVEAAKAITASTPQGEDRDRT